MLKMDGGRKGLFFTRRNNLYGLNMDEGEGEGEGTYFHKEKRAVGAKNGGREGGRDVVKKEALGGWM